MSRYVPEFALLTGLVLSLTVLVAGLLFTGDVLRSVLAFAVLCYPFVGFAVLRSEDPTTVLHPTAVLAVGALVGVVVWVAALWADRSLGSVLFGLFLALLAVLPAAAYRVHFGSRPPVDPRRAGVVATLLAVCCLALALVADETLFGVADALLLGVGAGLYADHQGVRPTPRTRRLLVAGGAVVGVGVVVAGVALGPRGLGDWTVVGIAAVLGPSVYVALTGRRGRR